MVLTSLVVPLAKLPILLLPIDLVWLELIVHPVSALAFESADAGPELMLASPRDPRAQLVDQYSALVSAACGVLLALGAVLIYWHRLPNGENYARAAAMVVVIGGSLMMVWAEYAAARTWGKVGLPDEARFWLVIGTVAISLPAFILVGPIASLLMLSPISASDWAISLLIALVAVGWRVFESRQTPTWRSFMR